MNILHQLYSDYMEDTILGFHFIMENEKSYFDISCKDEEQGFEIFKIYHTYKSELNEPSLKERIIDISEYYRIVLVTNKIHLIENETIKFYDDVNVYECGKDFATLDKQNYR